MLGHVVEMPDAQFDAATAVMGCSPAYLALAVEALADAGADAGLDQELAGELVVETAAGTAELLRDPPPSRRAQGRRLARGQHRGRAGGARPRRRSRGLRGRRARLAGEDARVILFALARDDVADYVGALFLVYIILIFINVLISWIPRMPYNRALRAVLDFITETTDPYLNLFRRILPPIGGGGFALDLSPISASSCSSSLRGLVVGLIEG